MTIKLNMRRAAKLAGDRLVDQQPRLRSFILSCMREEGGFVGGDGEADLAQTAFGVEVLWALDEPLPLGPMEDFLHSYRDGAGLALEDLAALARCWSNLPATFLPRSTRETILAHIEAYRTSHGGYALQTDSKETSVWACFLAVGAYQDLLVEMPDAVTLVEAIQEVRCESGQFEPDSIDSALATACACLLLKQLGRGKDRDAAHWLDDQFDGERGCIAGIMLSEAELKATALGLHGLAEMKVVLTDARLRKQVTRYLGDLIETVPLNPVRHGKGNVDPEQVFWMLLGLGHSLDPYAYISQRAFN